jgi:23S rRNA U2552 (ribose-2'-O)-methylase RlmE/FtsJ
MYFLIPSTNTETYREIMYQTRITPPKEIISHSLCKYLGEIKERIASRDKEWDIFKKYTNPYEYIHTIVPFKKKSVSKYKPISRSYFKMVEMMDVFGLVQKPNRNLVLSGSGIPPIRTFHLAEGPGGFIEAVCNYRANPQDTYYGMTILEDENDDNVPAWKKSEYFLQTHPNIKIETGQDGTGNILRLANFDHCCAMYSSSMDLVTADGGFDFSKDFNKQEVCIADLLWAQTCYALALQRFNGSFVLKIFDSFYAHTMDLVYILSSFYKEVYLSKLQTSRIGNSEKYIVCKGFRFHRCETFLPYIHASFVAMMNSNGEHIHRFLKIQIPRLFISKLEDCNSMFGQQQIENIYYTISIIDKNQKGDKSEQLIKQNMAKCINWCIEHEIPYNNMANNNIFLTCT